MSFPDSSFFDEINGSGTAAKGNYQQLFVPRVKYSIVWQHSLRRIDVDISELTQNSTEVVLFFSPSSCADFATI